MQKSETRQFLEEQFDKYEKAKNQQADNMYAPETAAEEADEYLLAPAAYGEEAGRIFKTLPFAMRRYLHEREHEIANAFSKFNDELKLKHFLDKAFLSKGCRHGFKTAKDWIEKLIFAEEMIEAFPRDTLRFLAKAYGVEQDLSEMKDKSVDVCELKIDLLTQALHRLQERFDERERSYAEAAAAAEAVRKAKAAGFSPRGKAAKAEDEQELTTRQLLERKFAELED